MASRLVASSPRLGGEAAGFLRPEKTGRGPNVNGYHPPALGSRSVTSPVLVTAALAAALATASVVATAAFAAAAFAAALAAAALAPLAAATSPLHVS
jgi:hypothetical protein